MIHTETDSFFFHFFVEDFAKEINARPHLRAAIELSEISPGHQSNLGRVGAILHAGEVGYFKDVTNCNPNVEFVGQRPKMYSVNLCETFKPIEGLNYLMNVRQKAVAQGVARSQIKRFKHEDYVRMYNCWALISVVNRLISS